MCPHPPSAVTGPRLLKRVSALPPCAFFDLETFTGSRPIPGLGAHPHSASNLPGLTQENRSPWQIIERFAPRVARAAACC